MKYTNTTNIPLSLAVMLANDTYDYNTDPRTISVTTLLKPIKKIVLGLRASQSNEVDISSRLASIKGTALHDSLERAWLNNHKQALLALGESKSIVDRFKINPTKVSNNDIPVYLEVRSSKQLNDWTISSKFDIVIDGKISDLKTTKTYTYIKGTNDDDYIKQLSMYRWVNQDIVTEDIGSILYWFQDWTKLNQLKSKGKYPPSEMVEKNFNLLSIQETSKFISNKLNEISKYIDLPEKELPPCSKEDLWQTESTFKYYKNSSKITRSTKNYDTYWEANERLISDGSVGVIIEKKGVAKACPYCAVNLLCTQYKQLQKEGLIE